MNTRNKNKLVKLPQVKLEFGKKSFKFQRATLYNVHLRLSENILKAY